MNNLKKKFHSLPYVIHEVLKYLACCLVALICFGFVGFTIFLATINPILAGAEFFLAVGAAIYFGISKI